MAESEFLRNIRVMKEKRERKLMSLGKDPIAEIEKCTLVKRNAIIEDQYQVQMTIIWHNWPSDSFAEIEYSKMTFVWKKIWKIGRENNTKIFKFGLSIKLLIKLFNENLLAKFLKEL